MVHNSWSKTNTIIPLEEEEVFKGQLYKIMIPSLEFWKIRYHLDRCGINHASMFPDMVGLCDHLVWLNTNQEDAPSKS